MGMACRKSEIQHFLRKIKTKNELNNCLSRKLYILMTAYHTNRCFSFLNAAKDLMLPKIVEKLIIRQFDFVSQQKFQQFRACTLQVWKSIAKRVGRGYHSYAIATTWN